MLIFGVNISVEAVHSAINAQSLAAISLSISVRTSSSFASAFSHADS